MAPELFEKIFTKITTPLLTSITDTSSRVASAITPTATTLLLIYICFWAWALVRGLIQEPILDATGRLVKLCLVYAIALTAVHYTTFVINFFWNTPEAIAGIIVSDPRLSAPDGSMGFLDDFLFIYYLYAEAWIKAAETNSTFGIPKPSQFVMGYLILLTGIINTSIAAFFLLLAKVALAVILGIGPIFIIGLFFEYTRKLFDAWLGQVLNYVFIFALIAASMALVGTEVFNQSRVAYDAACTAVDSCTREPDFSSAVVIIILSFISIFFYFLVPGIAAALGGGAALHSMGAIGWAYARARGMAFGTARELSGRGHGERAMRRMQVTRAREWARRNPGLPMRATRNVKDRVVNIFKPGNKVEKT